MKLLLGIVSIIIVLVLAILIILDLWGYELISWHTVSKGGVMIAVIAISSLLICLIYSLFIKKHSQDKKESSKRVKPIN
ncbi:hypothetical protein [Flavobacterium sp. FlaQc-28]|uniref:hypothetical protein n=1 Tax=Flavobacterium sp. FlaQc-28 TaxID=3374178 RepID=UPI003756C195